MKSFRFGLILLFSHSVFAGEPVPHPESAVVLQRKLAIHAPGKVSSVVWSVQRSVCLVQLDFPQYPEGELMPDGPSTQVWLLKADGTAIAKINKPHAIAISMSGWETPVVDYLFPPIAASDAVAVVVQVDGEYFVESLAMKP
jgi:hypothetical protein